jgi:hypothetical protein
VIKRTTESVKSTALYVGTVASEASTNAYKKVDEFSGGQVTAAA